MVKKYIPKGERKKLKDEKTGVPKKEATKKTKENSSNVEPETEPEEPEEQPWNGEAIPDVIDSVIDFGHLRS